MLDKEPGSPPAASPPTTTTVSSPMEAHTEEPAQRDEPAENLTASPRSPPTPAPEPSPAAQSPGLGSGTKEDEVQVTGTRHVPVQDAPEVLAKVTTPAAKPVPSAKGKDPVPAADLPALDSMSTPALCDEYFSHLAQHNNMETELVAMIQKRYQVHFFLVFTFSCITIP